METIKKMALKLIKAIDDNTIVMYNFNGESDLFITQRFIADELEELREKIGEKKWKKKSK